MSYVDGFVLPLLKSNKEQYIEMATKASKIWKEHGALSYFECIVEDTNAHGMVDFPQLIAAKEGETVVFAFITYRSREHRDEVNAKVMNDERIKDMCDPNNPPFEFSRMAYGGFETVVQA